MKVVNKKLNKAQLATVCLLVVSILLLSAYLLVSAIIKNRASAPSGNTGSGSSLELWEGESSYLNQPVAYPAIQEKQILLLRVDGPEGKFDIARYPDDQGSFMFHYYVDGEEKSIPYVPPIYSAESNFSYESLYAVEQNDGYGRIYLLTYLCSAIGSPYFTERIDLPEGDDADSVAKRNALLTEYGLTQQDSTMISFTYGERDSQTGLIVEGSEKVHNVAVGKKAVSGIGYYFMVDGRNCVYYTQSEYFKYALVGFHKFVKGMLVSAGLSVDSTYEPYLTTDFKTWIGTVYKEESDKVFTYTQAEIDKGYENPEVIVNASVKTPITDVDFKPGDSDFDGYGVDDGGLYTFNLQQLKSREDFKRITSALVGKNVGSYENEKILLTLLQAVYNSDTKRIDFGGDFGEVLYSYEVSAIESVISDTSERTEGQVGADDGLVKITYRYTVGDFTIQHDCHAVINLNDLSDSDRAKLVGLDIGPLATPITLDITYFRNVYEYTVEKIEAVINSDDTEKTTDTVLSKDNKLRIVYSVKLNGEVVETGKTATVDLTTVPSADALVFRGAQIGVDLDDDERLVFKKIDTNAPTRSEKFTITEILAIKDDNEASMSVVTAASTVYFSYSYEIDGVEVESGTDRVRLASIEDSNRFAPLKTELLGMSTGKISKGGFTVFNSDYHYEWMREFVTYEISEIKYFVVNEIVVSFAFSNASERDPYYGDTFFKNTLKNEYSLYGLNSDSCEEVVKYFGGIGTDSSSALGFAGETVAVGLTPRVMDEYGLYAHRIYFELPRYIEDATGGTEGDTSEKLSDYSWKWELGFTLYISDPLFDEDGTRVRYIGSDMYDLVAKVPADNLDFLERDFVDFWARRNVLMMSVSNLDEMKLTFNMDDLKGEYTFDVTFDTYYGGYVNGEYVTSLEKFNGSSPIDEQRVNVSTTSDSFNTKIKELMEAAGDGKYVYGLTPLYDRTMGDGTTTYYPGSYDTLGTAYFNAAFEIIQLTRYHGMHGLTDKEKAEMYDTCKVIFSISLKVEGTEEYYTYDFYRVDDRRIVVSLYRTDTDGRILDGGMKVSDFYITTFAFKKIVGNYVNLLNGNEVDEEISYPEIG